MGNKIPYGIDITEIDGFDDLHHADGMIREAEERAARLYHAEETHFLVNGSTVGILSAILGTTQKGERILAARNCHKSVYHAVFLNELEADYLYPESCEALGINGEITLREIEKALERDSRRKPGEKRIKAVVIVSPTYDGVVSDVGAIAGVVHRYGIPLIVDEAHGAHFGFSPHFPQNSNQMGADIVIHSVHKTLPALTQTALIHLNGQLVDRDRVRMYLRMLQSSSPSYLLMASIDACMEMLEREVKSGGKLFSEYAGRLDWLRGELGGLEKLELVRTEHFDKSKLVISTSGTDLTGRELYRILLETYHLQMEMAAPSYVLAMTSIADTREGFERLREALFEIDGQAERRERDGGFEIPEAKRRCTIAEAVAADGEQVSWEAAKGCVSCEYAYLYPPGIPILAPGEIVTEGVQRCLDMYRKYGFEIEGTRTHGMLDVLRPEERLR